jgi:hypothetical protein
VRSSHDDRHISGGFREWPVDRSRGLVVTNPRRQRHPEPVHDRRRYGDPLDLGHITTALWCADQRASDSN